MIAIMLRGVKRFLDNRKEFYPRLQRRAYEGVLKLAVGRSPLPALALLNPNINAKLIESLYHNENQHNK